MFDNEIEVYDGYMTVTYNVWRDWGFIMRKKLKNKSIFIYLHVECSFLFTLSIFFLHGLPIGPFFSQTQYWYIVSATDYTMYYELTIVFN